MGYNQALAAYRETGVKTASGGKLIIMLYDEAVRQLDSAVSWLSSDSRENPQRLEKANNSILKTQEIITELMASLDMDAGGDIAKNLLSLYVYFNQELLDANIAKNREKIIVIRDMIDQLRVVWHQIVQTQSAPVPQAASQGLNITG